MLYFRWMLKAAINNSTETFWFKDEILESRSMNSDIVTSVKYQKELDKDFKKCVREAIFEISFPAPQIYKTVDVKQPFNFYIRE